MIEGGSEGVAAVRGVLLGGLCAAGHRAVHCYAVGGAAILYYRTMVGDSLCAYHSNNPPNCRAEAG